MGMSWPNALSVFMPRPSYPSPSLAAAVRSHFSLTQAELADFIGVSRTYLANVEAGRRELSEGPRHRLRVLARHLPPPTEPPVPVLPTEAAAPLDPGPVLARLRRARFYLAQARFELTQRENWDQLHTRRRWALAVLRPALAAPDAGTHHPGTTPDPVADLRWLDGLVRATAAAPAPLTAAARALLLGRVAGLEAEIAVLEAAL